MELWFAAHGRTLYALAGGGERAGWVANIRREPAVEVLVGGARLAGRGRVVAGGDEDALARRLLLEKYQPGHGGDLTRWSRESLPVAIDLHT